jgi:uncharacterized membrane protein
MSGTVAKAPRLESLLAGLLGYGTWLASGVIGLGLVMPLTGLSGTHVVAAGVALFIALPALRVLLMLAVFIRERDNRLVAVTAVVLMTILAGLAIGIYVSNPSALAH